MTYFLVKGDVVRHEYMGESTSFEDIRLVVADNAEEALAKWETYWERKSSDYGYTYHAYGEVMETLE